MRSVAHGIEHTIAAQEPKHDSPIALLRLTSELVTLLRQNPDSLRLRVDGRRTLLHVGAQSIPLNAFAEVAETRQGGVDGEVECMQVRRAEMTHSNATGAQRIFATVGRAHVKLQAVSGVESAIGTERSGASQPEDLRAGTKGIKRKGVHDVVPAANVALAASTALRKRPRRQNAPRDMASSAAAARAVPGRYSSAAAASAVASPGANGGATRTKAAARTRAIKAAARSRQPKTHTEVRLSPNKTNVNLTNKTEAKTLARLRASVGRDFDSGLHIGAHVRGGAMRLQLAPVRRKGVAQGAPTDARHLAGARVFAEDGALLDANVHAPRIASLEDYRRCAATWEQLRKLGAVLYAPLRRNAKRFVVLERAVRVAAAAGDAAALRAAREAIARRYVAVLSDAEDTSEELRCVRIATRALSERATAWVAEYGVALAAAAPSP